MTEVHSCSYYCDRPECIKAQRDELRDRLGSMTDREIMQRALEALEWNLPVIEDYGDHEQLNRQHRAIIALRDRLAQPEQEPLQFKCTVIDDAHPNGVPLEQWGKQPEQEPVTLPCCGYADASAVKWNPYNQVVQCHNCGQTYTTPPQRKPLTDAEISEIAINNPPMVHEFARAIEAAHGIKGEA